MLASAPETWHLVVDLGVMYGKAWGRGRGHWFSSVVKLIILWGSDKREAQLLRRCNDSLGFLTPPTSVVSTRVAYNSPK